jgi:hypothetical protein
MSVYKLAGVNIVFEVFDGEIVAVHLDSGKYYSLKDSASDVWNAMMANQSNQAIAQRLSSHYLLDEKLTLSQIDDFIHQLVQEGLLVANDETPESASLLEHPQGLYIAPTFEVFNDMQEILLLDPVHDVDDSGWPVANKR